MRWRIYDEAVEMVEQRFQYLPRVFRWRGRYYDVESVERCWAFSRRRWRGRVERRFFRVRCAQDVFELYQNLRAGTWHLRRARLLPVRALAVRRVSQAWR
jgi:hypothetical protein